MDLSNVPSTIIFTVIYNAIYRLLQFLMRRYAIEHQIGLFLKKQCVSCSRQRFALNPLKSVTEELID